MSRRSPLGVALGLGSAKDGTPHWWAQRVSAVALAPLGLWFVISIVRLAAGRNLGHASVVEWIKAPVSTVALVLLIVILVYHSRLGVQVVLEDYVHEGWLKVCSLLLSSFAHVIVGAAGVYAVLRIAFGSPGA